MDASVLGKGTGEIDASRLRLLGVDADGVVSFLDGI
jgi:hypothetical protein